MLVPSIVIGTSSVRDPDLSRPSWSVFAGGCRNVKSSFVTGRTVLKSGGSAVGTRAVLLVICRMLFAWLRT